MNCKINSLGGAKIPYFEHKYHGAVLYLENTLKQFLCLLRGIRIPAIRELCRLDCYCFFYPGAIYPAHFLKHGGMTVPGVACYTL